MNVPITFIVDFQYFDYDMPKCGFLHIFPTLGFAKIAACLISFIKYDLYLYLYTILPEVMGFTSNVAIPNLTLALCIWDNV